MSNIIVSPSQEDKKPSRFLRKVVVVLGILAIATFAAFLAALIIVVGSQTPAPVVQPSFCCKNEAANLLEGLSPTLKPCNNFYDYVCAQYANATSSLLPIAFRIQVQLVSLDKYPQLAKAPLSEVFTNLATSCAEQDWKPYFAAANFTSSILKVGNLSASMNASKLLRLFLLMSIKYHLSAPIFFRTSINVSQDTEFTLVIEQQHSPAIELNHICSDCILAVLHAVNDAFNVNITLANLLEFDKFVNDSKPASGKPTFMLKDISHPPIHGVKPYDWNAILKEVVFPIYPDILHLEQDTQGRYDLLDSLANPENQPVSIAYISAFIVVHAYESLRGGARSQEGNNEGCSDAVRLIRELKDAFEAQAVTNQPRDDQVRELFSVVQGFVARDALSGRPLNDEGEVAIRKELDTLKLLLPRDVTAADLPAPTIPSGFLSGILAVRSYAYDVKRMKVERRIPLSLELFPPDVVRRDDKIFISSALYLMMEFESEHWLYLNLPVVGVRMARELWSFLLDDKRPWSLKTRDNIAAYQRCLQVTTFGGQPSNETHNYLMAMTKGFSSITKVINKSEWYDIKKVSGSTEVSRGQLYYLRFAHSFCTGTFFDPKTMEVNIPIKSEQNFALTYHCSPTDEMVQPTGC